MPNKNDTHRSKREALEEKRIEALIEALKDDISIFGPAVDDLARLRIYEIRLNVLKNAKQKRHAQTQSN